MMRRIRRIVAHPAVKVGYFALLLAAAVFYLVRWGSRMPDLLSQVQPVWVAAAFVLSCLSSLLYSYIQYAIFRQLGVRPTYWTVFRIVSISQLGKYLPGKVLFAGNFYLLSREAGIDNLRIGASFAISMAVWILTASLCGIPVLGLLQPALRYSILILPILLALLVHPRFLGLLLNIAQRMAGRVRGSSSVPASPVGGQAEASAEFSVPDLAELGISFYFRVAFLYLAAWMLAGLGAYCSLRAFAPMEFGIYPLALASIALGTVAGFLVLFAPVGLGIREGIGALILSPAVGADVALLSMVLLRGVTVAIDMLLALGAMLAGRTAVALARSKDERC
jgi:glycosyltransferase 2 family protein